MILKGTNQYKQFLGSKSYLHGYILLVSGFAWPNQTPIGTASNFLQCKWVIIVVANPIGRAMIKGYRGPEFPAAISGANILPKKKITVSLGRLVWRWREVRAGDTSKERECVCFWLVGLQLVIAGWIGQTSWELSTTLMHIAAGQQQQASSSMQTAAGKQQQASSSSERAAAGISSRQAAGISSRQAASKQQASSSNQRMPPWKNDQI